jgi:hypothetical protein
MVTKLLWLRYPVPSLGTRALKLCPVTDLNTSLQAKGQKLSKRFVLNCITCPLCLTNYVFIINITTHCICNNFDLSMFFFSKSSEHESFLVTSISPNILMQIRI